MGEGVGGFAVKGGGLRCLPFFRARRSSLGTRDAGAAGLCRPLVASASAPTFPLMPA